MLFRSVQPAADKAEVTVLFDVDDEHAVTGDSARLQQVIWNLLSNGVKFQGADDRLGAIRGGEHAPAGLRLGLHPFCRHPAEGPGIGRASRREGGGAPGGGGAGAGAGGGWGVESWRGYRVTRRPWGWRGVTRTTSWCRTSAASAAAAGT